MKTPSKHKKVHTGKNWSKSVNIKTGRPTKRNEETVQKLIQCIRQGCTREEACRYTWIARQSFYNWLKDSDFLDKILRAEDYLVIVAKKTWVSKILEWDYQACKEWLERREPKEYWRKRAICNNCNWTNQSFSDFGNNSEDYPRIPIEIINR